jgi:hypothetical protein
LTGGVYSFNLSDATQVLAGSVTYHRQSMEAMRQGEDNSALGKHWQALASIGKHWQSIASAPGPTSIR